MILYDYLISLLEIEVVFGIVNAYKLSSSSHIELIRFVIYCREQMQDKLAQEF